MCKLANVHQVLGKGGTVSLQVQDAWHADMGCLCLWDPSSPSKPTTNLISEGCPTACTFLSAPGRGSLVLAGQ